MNAYQQGVKAFNNGKNHWNNPYKTTEAGFGLWQKGWMDAIHM